MDTQNLTPPPPSSRSGRELLSPALVDSHGADSHGADGDGQAADASPLAECIPFAFPGVPHVRCVFSTALAGNFMLAPLITGAARSERRNAVVVANRRRVLGALGLERWVEMKQVHGDRLEEEPAATPLEKAAIQERDGICTSEQKLALAVKTADCQPILLTDVQGRAVAALHVGWRGNVLNFPGSGVAAFCRRYNFRPEELLAVRGPSLGPGAAEFVNFESEWPAGFQPWFSPTTRRMDLWSLTRHQLTEAGLLPGNIFSLDLCTYDLHNMFFSFRRGHQGRMVSLIWRV